MRLIRPLLIGLALVWPSVAIAQAGKKAVKVEVPSERPDIDAVVKSSLKSTPEHVEAVLEALRKKLSQSSLVDNVWGADETPEDGAAPYRLVVQHTGTAAVGSAIVRMYCDYKTLDVNLGVSRTVDSSTLITQWAVEVRQTTTIEYQLMKWNAASGKYQPVQRWFAPVPNAFARLRKVEELECPVGKYTPRNPPPCPLSLKEAKEIALLQCVPTDIPDPVMGLVTARLGRTKVTRAPVGGNIIQGPPTDADAEVIIVNNSPWTITGVNAQAWWEDRSQPILAAGDVDLETPIAPKRQGTLVLKGGLGAVYIPSDLKNQSKSGVNVVSVRFGR